jgi:hypothetical protein
VAGAHLSWQEFVLWFNKTSARELEDCLVPRISHPSDTSHSVCNRQKEMAFKENYRWSSERRFRSPNHGGFPSVLVAEKVWPSASSPHFSLRLSKACAFFVHNRGYIYSKSAFPCRKSTIDLAQDKPANPFCP